MTQREPIGSGSFYVLCLPPYFHPSGTKQGSAVKHDVSVQDLNNCQRDKNYLHRLTPSLGKESLT